MLFNRLIRNFGHKISSPIPLQPRRIDGVEHALKRRKRHRSRQFKLRRPKLPYRSKNVFNLVQGTAVRPDNSAHCLAVQLLRKRWSRRHLQEGEKAVQLFRLRRRDFSIPLKQFVRMLHLPKHGTCKHLIHRTPAKEKGSDNTKVSATATDRPKQIRVFFDVCGHETAISQYDIGFQQIIKSQTIFPRQIAGSTTEGESSDSRGRNDSNRDSQAKTMSRMV